MEAMLVAASTAASIAFAFGVAIVSYFLIRRSRQHLARLKQSQSEIQVVTNPVASISAPSDVTRSHVALHDFARDMMAELDTKMSALRALIHMADETSARLQAELARAERLGLSAHRDTLEALATLSTENRKEFASLIHDLDQESKTIRHVHEPHQTQQVLQLAREGHSAQFIANELGIPIGDVELVLSLHSH